jgi:hypothetical protein
LPTDKHVRKRLAARNRKWVDEVNAVTVCAECGAQPIEWHGFHHAQGKAHHRISSLVARGVSITRIQHEMDLCTPLCPACHVRVDGRLDNLRATQPYQRGQIYVGTLPCSCCQQLAKPLRKGMCTGCYNHHTGLRRRKKRLNNCWCDLT